MLGTTDFFTVPTATFRILFTFIILRHDSRGVVHFNVTERPTSDWTAQQIVEAIPDNEAPRFLIRDRDSIYGRSFQTRVANVGIEEVICSPRSPWQNPYAERVIGSIKRECLRHVIVLNEWYLLRILRSYFDYYHESRTHLSLNRNSPVRCNVEPREQGRVISIPKVGGLHHRYRRAARDASRFREILSASALVRPLDANSAIGERNSVFRKPRISPFDAQRHRKSDRDRAKSKRRAFSGWTTPSAVGGRQRVNSRPPRFARRSPHDQRTHKQQKQAHDTDTPF